MGGWIPTDAAGWPAIAEALSSTGAAWPEAAAITDLRWWVDRAAYLAGLSDLRAEDLTDEHRAILRDGLPGRPTLARRWGWTDWAVRTLLRASARWWDRARWGLDADDHQAPTSPTPGSRQRPASDPPAGARMDADDRREWAEDFVLGKDYALLTGAQLQAVKAQLDDISPQVKGLLVVFEPGLHMICLKRQMPLGRALRRFLVDTVLPELVRTGAYKPAGATADRALAILYRTAALADDLIHEASALLAYLTGEWRGCTHEDGGAPGCPMCEGRWSAEVRAAVQALQQVGRAGVVTAGSDDGLREVAEALVALVGPPLDPSLPLAVRLAWVAGRTGGVVS